MNKLKKISALLICLLLLFSLVGCMGVKEDLSYSPKNEKTENISNPTDLPLVVDEKEKQVEEDVALEEQLIENDILDNIEVNFIDVGQGDSCFIVTANNDTILIDTGDSKKAEEIIDCLNGYEFEDIDLMILTHPDSDHISGAQTIIENYTVNEVLMSSYVKDTKLFMNLLTCMDDKDIKVTQAKLGQEFNIDNVNFLVVGVDSVPKHCNNSSVVTKMTYGDVSILFTGDLEEKGEEVVLNNGYDLSAQVLKAGHHGSDTSSSLEFLQAVNPKMAVISVGEGNKYGHPCEVTLDKYNDLGIKYYRTDEDGTVLLEIDGMNITTVLNDSFDMSNSFAKRNFLFVPDVASVEIITEQGVLDSIGAN